MAQEKIYSDIDFTFTKKPVTKDIALSYNEKAVLRSIRNLLSTRKFERPFNPDLGSNLDALLFELISPLTGIALEKECRSLLEKYEPRAIIQSLNVNPQPDKNAYSLTLSFYMENSTTPIDVQLILERNR